jgi:osmotically-inducible protein OsmY
MKWMPMRTLFSEFAMALANTTISSHAVSEIGEIPLREAATLRAKRRLQRNVLKAFVVNRLDISDMRVKVNGALIALEGTLSNTHDIDTAVLIARNVDGVCAVRDALSVRAKVCHTLN